MTCTDVCQYFYRMSFFFFNDTATTEIYTLSLHDALPILDQQNDYRASRTLERLLPRVRAELGEATHTPEWEAWEQDRKSTRLNSSHANISYAVFCLKKKKKKNRIIIINNCTVRLNISDIV